MGRKKNGVAKSVGLARECVVALTIGTLTAQPVLAATLPTAGSVAAGQVSIGTSGNTTTVTQGSHKAIVNWGSFSVGEGASVNFIQPDSTSAILNRVTGSTTSVIAGSINANGQVFLINPNGLAITSTGSIKVGGGFVGSTLNITDKDFLDGHLVFDGNGASAGVSNAGIISVGRDGYAALIGGTVQNKGLIAAPLGKIGLGAGEQATLDFSGDGFLQVALPTHERTEDNNALIDNQGTLSADGGTVLISVASARDAARHAINLSGVVEANSVSGHDGKIIIGGGEGGDVTVSGNITATSASGKGGDITVTGKNIALNEATLDASGATGGGSIKVGGDYQGKGTIQHADTTRVNANSIIRADATQSGDGGKVIVWSEDLTTFDGEIAARGAGSGTGGNAEVSGKAILAYKGFADLSGPGGFGTLLLDPYNITISSDTASNSSGTSATGDDSVINVATLENALGSANVEVSTGSGGSQNGDIVIASEVSWSSDTTLTLNAAGSITVNAAITASGENAGLVLTYAADGDYHVNAPITLSGASATLNINDNDYTLIHSVADAFSTLNGEGSYFALAQDLDLSDTPFTAAPVTTFAGTLTGLGHTVSNLTIDAPNTDNVGLIGTNTGIVRDLGMVEGSVTGQSNVGSLVGVNEGTISNAYATGTVKGITGAYQAYYAGGLVGRNNGTISNAYATGAVTGDYYVGGLAGHNGKGTISNAYATGTVKGNYYVGGLVGNVGGTKTNYSTVSNVYATGSVTGDNYIGGLAGNSNIYSTIRNAYATGAVTGHTYFGGLVGTNKGTISHAYATGNVTGGNYLGGLVGDNYQGTINNVYATGTVTGRGAVGGLVGRNNGTVSNAYATGEVMGIDGIGGLLGSNERGAVSNAYATGTVTGRDYVGGLAGHNSISTISNAYATGMVTGEDYVGGLVGSNSFHATISNSYATGAVTGSHYVGGLAGDNLISTISNVYAIGAVKGQGVVGGLVGKNDRSTISNAYATGMVTGETYVGGFVGTNTGNQDTSGKISNAYATGMVTGTRNLQYVNGLVGNNTTYGKITSSFWDKQTTGQASGVGNVASASGVTGLTTAQMKTLSSFSGWDIDGEGGTGKVWRIYEGYTAPLLRSFMTGLTITGGSGSKTYDGSATSTNVGTLTYSDANYDASLISGMAQAYYKTNSANAGTYNGLTLTGLYSSQQGYDISTQPGSLTINKAALTVTANDAAKTYDGQAFTGGNGVTYSGLVNNETSSVLGGTLTYGGTSQGVVNAGSYDIDVSGLTSGNYDIAYVPGQLTIDKAVLTVIANDASKTYDGQAFTGGNGVTYSGLVNNETSSVLGGTLSYGGTAQGAVNAGSYAIDVSGLTSGNYDIAYVPGQLTIDKAALTVTANDATKTYDGLAFAGGNGVTYSGLVNNETSSVLDGTLTYGGTSQGAVNAGSYAIDVSGLTSGNYDIAYVPGQLTLDKAALTVTANDAAKTYDGLAFTGGNGVTYSGLVNNETSSVLGGTLTYGGTAQGAVNAGSYAIDVSGLTSGNYDIAYVSGQLTIDKAALTVTANDAAKTYDGQAFSGGNGVTYSGFVNNETSSVLDGTLTYGGTSQGAVDAGSYGIDVSGLTSGNYDIAYVPGQLTIDKAALTVTANDAAKAYDGQAFAGGNGVTYSGLVNNETSAVLGGTLTYGGTSQGAIDVGNFAIDVSGLTSGNYDIAYVSGELIVTAAP
jgi:filamentous hemagglutinin family protein